MREHFAEYLGMENALDNPNDLMAYSYDASGMEGKARIVLFPRSAEDVRKILTFANRTNIPIVPRGLGTNPLGMVVPENAIVLDMGNFDRIHSINLKEEWVRVDTGVILEDLQRQLREHGYEFPINPESRSVATIGALLAMNQMSRRSHAHGRLDKHVLELEFIDGSGKHFTQGNLDFLGLEGVGAIFLAAKIRILPVVQETSSTLLEFDSHEDCLEEASTYIDDLTVLSMEYMNATLSKMCGLPAKHHLLLEYKGKNGEIINPDSQKKLWKKRDSAWRSASQHGFPILGDCFASTQSMVEVLNYCEKRNLPVAGHLGMGILHPFFSNQDHIDFFRHLENVGADPVGQLGYGLVKKAYVPKRIKDKIILLKDEYDYNDIIQRGKLHDYA